jgi:Protein of unknown function (DUF3237)
MQPALEFAFAIEASLEPTIVVGDTPEGMRRVVPIAGGRVEGPAIRGELLPGGCDWQLVRPDGVTLPEALYLLRTDDGVLIQVHNRGMRHGPPAVMAKLAAGENVDPSDYYFRAIPTFSTPAGRYDWLNRSVFICTGERYPSSIRLEFYRVT